MHSIAVVELGDFASSDCAEADARRQDLSWLGHRCPTATDLGFGYGVFFANFAGAGAGSSVSAF
jgi:hypothetical protein